MGLLRSMGGKSTAGERHGPVSRTGHVSRILTVICALALLSAGPLSALQSAQFQASEAQVKSAYLFNFGKYVTWPPIPGNHFYICILGADTLGSSIDDVASGEKVAGKTAEVRHIHSVQDAFGCQVVFIANSESAHLQSVLSALAKAPILTVSDIGDFTSRGGMIQLVVEGNRVRFLVNLQAAQKAGLNLSSELLKVAKAVLRDVPPGGM